MILESILMFWAWMLAVVTMLALLSNLTHPACGRRRGRRCNVHNGPGVWK